MGTSYFILVILILIISIYRGKSTINSKQRNVFNNRNENNFQQQFGQDNQFTDPNFPGFNNASQIENNNLFHHSQPENIIHHHHHINHDFHDNLNNNNPDFNIPDSSYDNNISSS